MNANTSDEVLNTPSVPRRAFTAADWLMMVATPFILYLGGVAAAGGNANGLILVGLAGLAVITLRTVRLGRRNEPRVPRWSGPGAIVVAVFSFVLSWNLSQNPASDVADQYAWPAIPVALYFIFVLAMFMPRKVR